MAALPTGTVTFLFTDIESSTATLQRLGDRRYAEVLQEHRHLLRAAFDEGHGQVVDTQGDAFLVVFSRARDAVGTAVSAQRALTKHAWPGGASLQVRMGLHTGEPIEESGTYVGLDVHRASRICSVGHGGQILVSQAVGILVAHDLPHDVSLRALGTHRLKDLKEPEHILQVVHPDLPADFPPLESLDARPNNLPIQLTSFIGRAREIAEVKRLLGAARLVTLTGSGGAGKTRLALQTAADVLDDYPDGVWLSEFAPVADSALVPETVAAALNVPEQPGRKMTATLVDNLRSKTLLLVLDNCEHLLPACADLAVALLRACPQVRILATSREGLGVPGEILWRVPSLSLPEDVDHLRPRDGLLLYEAVRLFVDRAMAVAPGFAITQENALAVAQVCRRLDGIPLAIELAAARAKVLAVEQIAARLDDRLRLLTGSSRVVAPRHQTLRAAIDWSYYLLSEKERALLRRLAAFAGGWTLEAAESVCAGGSVEASSILDLLASLADKSLVFVEMQRGEARYRFLETVRQYAQDRLLEASEGAEIRTRHREWCLRLAQRADPELRGPNQSVWLDRLETEHDNMRAALEWGKADAAGAPAYVLLAGALFWFWYLRGHWVEGRKWLEAALVRSEDVEPAARIRAFEGTAMLARDQGDHAHGDALAAKGLALSREVGDQHGVAWFLLTLGISANAQSDRTRATTLTEESLALCEEVGDSWMSVIVLHTLGHIALKQAEYGRASAFFEKSLSLSREVGDKYLIAMELRNLGYVALTQGEYPWAATLQKESLTLCKDVGPRWLTEVCLRDLALVACAAGNYKQAARLFGAAEASREFLERSMGERVLHDRGVASAKAQLGDSTFAECWAEGRAMTLGQALESALAVEWK